MRIFIGSSKEQIDNMKRLAIQLEGLGHEVIRWDKPGYLLWVNKLLKI